MSIMKVLLCVTYILAVITGLSQAKSVLSTNQEQDSSMNVVLGQAIKHDTQDGWSVLMQITKNATKAIPELASELGLTYLSNRISEAKLRDDLEAKGPFTLFGPTNAAFRALPDWLKKALKDVKTLAKFLSFHVLKDEFRSAQLKNEFLAETLLGPKLRVNIYKNAKKVIATAQCVPINLTRVDNNATNGVIHVLDGVISPPDGNAVAVLSAHAQFSILVKAVKAAGFVTTLSGDGPFTIFAPTNKAFAKLPPGTLPKLLKNPVVLAKILKYHIVAGTYCSHGLVSGEVATAEGQKLKITVSADGVTVNSAKVVVPDGSITNGVVHTIDTVLLPPALYL